MEIPFLILIMYLATATTIFLSGLVMGIRKINGAPMMCIFSGILIFGMLAITDDINAEGLTGKKTEFVVQNVTDYMNQQTSTGVSPLRSGSNIFFGEEIVNDNSILFGKEINQAQFRLDKDGTPTGDFYVGVWNTVINPTPTNYKFIIGQMKANATNVSQMNYVFTRNDTKTYTLGIDDAVGIFYNGGSLGNAINIASNATSSSFDGSTSARTLFLSSTNTWTDSSISDLRGKISLSVDLGKTQHEPFDFNNSDMWVYQTFMAVFFIFTGIVFQLQEWKP